MQTKRTCSVRTFAGCIAAREINLLIGPGQINRALALRNSFRQVFLVAFRDQKPPAELLMIFYEARNYNFN